MKQATFEFTGTVVRTYVGPKSAYITLDCAEEDSKFPNKQEVVFFGDGIAVVSALKQGDEVVVAGNMNTTKALGEDKQPIMKKGYAMYIPQAVGRTADKVGVIAGVEVLPPKATAKLPF